ncbi:hypothetical protein [Hypericibacter terrae]|uniref:hypothetical protein n=1 Tax=Hypericibacter terrae TaxID=2602015 RepID=UPI001CD93A34|nr:hypothetical protein [Hypericibacter terrae]
MQLAFDFVSSGGMGENQALLDRHSGKIHWHPEVLGEGVLEELPDDIDDEKYIEIPHRNELDLGRPLVMGFVGEFLPEDYDDVRRFFGKRGAYRRFKDLAARRGVIDRWHDFSAKAEEVALRAWCEENSIELGG